MLRMAAVAGIVSEDEIRKRSTGATLSPTRVGASRCAALGGLALPLRRLRMLLLRF